MLETKIFEYYGFGYDYYLLSHIQQGILVHKGDWSLLIRIEAFFAKLNELDLKVTLQVANKLQAVYVRASKLDKDATVDAALAREVHDALARLDATLDAELNLRSAYIVTPKRFELDSLLKNPENIFAANVFAQLPSICAYDFTAACKCIAFELPTAAAFHAMRGTEGVLRDYYCRIVKRNRREPLLWHPMVEHLRERRDAPPKALLDHLDNIRTNFRNPTQHPEMRYDMDEAQDLLAVSIDAINRTYRDIKKRSNKA